MTAVENTKKQSSSSKANEYLTEKFIEAIENGVSPLQTLWSSPHGMPRGYDGHQYRGANFWLALIAMHQFGWDVPVFITFKRAKEIGHPVLKGSKGIKVFYSSVYVPKEYKDTPELCPEEEKQFYTKMYTVFNVSQCENFDLSPFYGPERKQFRSIEEAEAVVAGYSDCPLIEHAEPRAYYSPKDDKVNMPKKETFVSPEAYYSVLFHELSHSTGAAHRLNRPMNTKKSTTEYAFEELVAELSAAYLVSQCGFIEKQFDNSAAYLDSWLQEFKSDSSFLRQAMSKAQKAADYINGVKF